MTSNFTFYELERSYCYVSDGEIERKALSSIGGIEAKLRYYYYYFYRENKFLVGRHKFQRGSREKTSTNSGQLYE